MTAGLHDLSTRKTEFVDTHCHIHEAGTDTAGDEFVRDKWAKDGLTDPVPLIRDAAKAGVTRLICVGCTLKDSQLAVELAQKEENCYASIGIHPHEAKHYVQAVPKRQAAKPLADSALSAQRGVADSSAPLPYQEYGSVRASPAPNAASEPEPSDSLAKLALLAGQPKVVAVGEIGLDYFYTHSPKKDQIKVLEFQLGLAQKHHLPLIFHIREAFDDFWPVFDQFKGLKGVVHSFSAGKRELEQILSRGLYVGLNGIMTFTKNSEQLMAAKAIPLQNLLLETDAPFLTPVPERGTICQPKHLVHTAEFLAGLRGEAIANIANATTQNACNLFSIK